MWDLNELAARVGCPVVLVTAATYLLVRIVRDLRRNGRPTLAAPVDDLDVRMDPEPVEHAGAFAPLLPEEQLTDEQAARIWAPVQAEIDARGIPSQRGPGERGGRPFGMASYPRRDGGRS